VTTVARLLPRHWDGRRLLQFLTGLALIALAFAVPALLGPAAPPAEAPVTIITTVDTPLSPGLPVIEPDPATHTRAGLALDADAAQDATAAQAADPAAAGVDQGVVRGEHGVLVQQRPQGRLICLEGRAAVGGATQRAHSERAPPRA
jgi:hypothetical protein